jgi:hypothetical protein
MHRQGFDLQLTQYDERGWRATFYTTGMQHCDGHWLGALALARDAAGGVGGAEEEASERVGRARVGKEDTTYTHCWSVLRS